MFALIRRTITMWESNTYIGQRFPDIDKIHNFPGDKLEIKSTT